MSLQFSKTMHGFYENVLPYLDLPGLGSHRSANEFPSQSFLTPFQLNFQMACIFTYNGIFVLMAFTNQNFTEKLKTCNFLSGVPTDLLCTGHNPL